MVAVEKQCTLLLNYQRSDDSFGASGDGLSAGGGGGFGPGGMGGSGRTSEELQRKLEDRDENVKIEALKEIISTIIGGDPLPRLLMPVIKFCLRSDNHTIKKLLLLYWEVVEKKGADGKLLPEMILVCNALLSDLNHANEYIRGSTLRLLCALKEPEILEQLIPPVQANLDHRHSYVRKNAVLAVFTIYQAHPELVPEGPAEIEKFLLAEANISAKRNAFLMLFHCDQNRAVSYLQSCIDQVKTMGESFQMVVLELIRKICRQNPSQKAVYLKCVYTLLNSQSKSVAYEAANTLLTLSSLDTAVRAAVQAMITLLTSESDNNVKLIILNRLLTLQRRHERTLQNSVMDILKTLSSPNIDIRRKTLQLGLDLACNRNIEDIINCLKKEILNTESSDEPNVVQYRTLLVETIHKCAVKFPDVASNVVHVLMNYLGDENQASARDVVYFVREIVEEYPRLRSSILAKLMENFNEIRSDSVYRVALWILGEYATEPETLKMALRTVVESIGKLPLVEQTTEDEEKKEDDEESSKSGTMDAQFAGPVVLADGTYASQSAAIVTDPQESTDAGGGTGGIEDISLRSLLLNGEYFLATAIANTFTKLVLRFMSLAGVKSPETNKEVAEGILLFTSILRLGASPKAKKKIDKDSHERIVLCIKTLLDPKPYADIFLRQCRQTFVNMLEEKRESKPEEEEKKAVAPTRQADDLINVRQLKGVAALGQFADLGEEDDDTNISRALGSSVLGGADFASRLGRIFQLTGFSDPVYAEACITVHEYDIVLDVLVINQTDKTLQNLSLEISTSGDLKLVERPQSYTLAPHDFKKIQANIKVSSTESGVIFGNIVYNTTGASSDPKLVVMNSIHMDIMDYIAPATCTSSKFSDMWAEFEWENKVPVNTDITNLTEYLEHVVSITNMRCLTPPHTLQGKSEFLAANLYARSIFGEDALLNLSVEMTNTGRIEGYIRIRSKTQGIALSLGDKITSKQRLTTGH